MAIRKAKQVPSGSGRDAVPVPQYFANLGWLKQHICYRKRSYNFSGVESEMDVLAAEATDRQIQLYGNSRYTTVNCRMSRSTSVCTAKG